MGKPLGNTSKTDTREQSSRGKRCFYFFRQCAFRHLCMDAFFNADELFQNGV